MLICTDSNYHILCLVNRDGDYLSPYRGPALKQFFDCLKDCIVTGDQHHHLHYGDILINIDSFNTITANEADLKMIRASGRPFTPESLSITTGYGQDDVEVVVAMCTERCLVVLIKINGENRVWTYNQIGSSP